MMIISLMISSSFAVVGANGARGDRTLYLYYTHTKETAKITFKRNGRYVKKGLSELNHMTRDWRRNEPTKMDPALFDLLWEVYQESGASGPIHIVSAYRSPTTNNMLRTKSKGVAKNSRHTHGQAIDFYIPGVRVSKVREIAMRKQVGGVGYYPTSNSPFIHLDTGNVRAWPRMTKAQLQRLFPSGKTLHVPNTGVPLSNKGYQLALVEWKKCRAVPCNPRSTTRVANTINTRANSNKKKNSPADDGTPKNLFDLFFNNEDNEGSEEGNISVASRTTPVQASIISARKPIKAPTPHSRPNSIQLAQITAPTPSVRPISIFESQDIKLQDTLKTNDAIQTASIDEDNNVPTPRILLSRLDDRQINSELTAYAPIRISTPDAQQAVKDLIERNIKETSANIISQNSTLADIPQDIIDSSFGAVINAGLSQPQKIELLKPEKTQQTFFSQRSVAIFAPDLDHVGEIFTDPSKISSSRYAIMFEPDEADFNPASELGRFGSKLSFDNDASSGLKMNKFISSSPLIIALR